MDASERPQKAPDARGARPRVMVLEADGALRRQLTGLLNAHQFSARAAADLRRVPDLPVRPACDLVVLGDVAPPGDRFSWCRSLAADPGPPVLMVNRSFDLTERVLALELGADDCLLWPGNPRELAARARAILRGRSLRGPETGTGDFGFGACRVDAARLHLVYPSGETLRLTTLEFFLLSAFAQRRGEILTRTHLREQLPEVAGAGSLRAIDVQVSRLRRKLGDEGRAQCRIQTVRGQGYVFRS